MTGIRFLSIALTLAATPLYAQKKVETSPPTPIVAKGTASLIFPKAEEISGARALEVKFDRFRGFTTISAPRGDLGFGGFQLTASLIYAGDTLKSLPRYVSVMLSWSGSTWQYLYSHGVAVLVDGEAMSPEHVSHDGRVGSGYVIEFIEFDLTPTQMARIGRAKKIEMQVGSTEGEVSEESLQTLRLVASRLRIP